MEPGSSFFNRSAESFIGDTFDAELLDRSLITGTRR